MLYINTFLNAIDSSCPLRRQSSFCKVPSRLLFPPHEVTFNPGTLGHRQSRIANGTRQGLLAKATLVLKNIQKLFPSLKDSVHCNLHGTASQTRRTWLLYFSCLAPASSWQPSLSLIPELQQLTVLGCCLHTKSEMKSNSFCPRKSSGNS